MSLNSLGLALAASLALFGGSLPSAADETLKIGVIAPLTGAGAPWGLAMTEGAKILASDYNATGGLDIGGTKYQVEIVAYDDRYNAADAISAYQRLVNEDGVSYIVLAAGVSTMAVKQSVEDDQIVAMTAGYIAEELDPNTEYMYRMWSIPADYFPPLYAWLKKNTTQRRVAIINPNDESARAMSHLSEQLMTDAGYTVLSNELYERSLKDFVPLLTKVLATDPDIIDLGATPPATAALLIREAREYGYKGLFFVSGSTAWKEIVDGAGAAAAEGVLTVLYVDPANEAYKRFAAEFEKAVNQEPNESMAPYTDGVNVLIQAIQKSGVVGDTSKFEEGFRKALPMELMQGELMTIGGMEKYGSTTRSMPSWLCRRHRGRPARCGRHDPVSHLGRPRRPGQWAGQVARAPAPWAGREILVDVDVGRLAHGEEHAAREAVGRYGVLLVEVPHPLLRRRPR